MNTSTETPEFSGSATYCPEDNKLRLYIGRVPKPEYLALRAAGWVALHKQRETGGGDFAAIWTPERRDTALEYAGIIEDEDKGPAERAVERAERFAVYREKRTAEAVGQADRFDAGPAAHGYQSQARAERSARRHDAIAGRAVDAWSKAEYWQSRTAGVISHALHVAAPGVRVGRIKDIEADLRKATARLEGHTKALAGWSKLGLTPEEALQLAYTQYGEFRMARKEGDRKDFNYSPSASDALQNSHPNLYAPRTLEEVIAAALRIFPRCIERAQDWITHFNLRLAYENQMIEAQGGRAAFVEMEPGGWIGERQIRKVNKSNATGRAVSVEVMGLRRGNDGNSRPCPVLINVERLPADSYRPPTDADKATLAETKKAEKAARPEKEPCPLLNPTDADAERLATLWNERRRAEFDCRYGASAKYYEFKLCTVERVTQATYSANSKGSYAKAETRGLCVGAELENGESNLWSRERDARAKRIGAPLCKIRIAGYDNYRVLIIMDKPQKALPEAVWQTSVLAALVARSEVLT